MKLTATAAPATAILPMSVRNPYTSEPAAFTAQDEVRLSTPPVVDSSDGEKRDIGTKVALVGAVLGVATLAGVILPVVGGVLKQAPEPAISQAVPASPGARTDPHASQQTAQTTSGAVSVTTAAKGEAGHAQEEHPPTASQRFDCEGEFDCDIQKFIISQAADLGLPMQPGTPDKPAPRQDPNQLFPAMATASEKASKSLLTVNQTHGKWLTDIGAMQATSKDLAFHVDQLMRGNGEAATHHSAIDQGLTKLGQQLDDFRKRVEKERPDVDKLLGQNRDVLNEAGTIELKLEERAKLAAATQTDPKARHELLQDAHLMHRGILDIAMATEKSTTVQIEDKALAKALEDLRKIMDEVQKANKTSSKDAKAMSQVDRGSAILDNAMRVLKNAVAKTEKDVEEAGARAHKGAVDNGYGQYSAVKARADS